MINIKLTVKDIVDATGGKLLCGDENTVIKDVCIDSRTVKEGDLFVPIIGEKNDAHIFIDSALEKAYATLTSEHSVVAGKKPHIKVDDTLKAFQAIAKYIRDKFSIPFIGVTGSVGKTTTREMIATALSQNTEIYQTIGNHNSQIGTALTLCGITKEANAGIIEMGMSEPGQMSILSEMVQPKICVVTMIGVAHIEYLKTKENIRKEKLCIIDHMQKDGVLFLNGDDPMLAELRGKTNVKTYFYGTQEWCDYRAENLQLNGYRYEYDFVHANKKTHVVLNALGKHNVGNSLVGMAISDYMGYNIDKAAKGYENFKGLRQKLIQIPNKYTIIDDTYNASPDSMKASINVLDELPVIGKKYIVLGDMFELGTNSVEYHYEVGKHLANKKIDELITVGDLSINIQKAVEDAGADIKCYHFVDNGEVALYLLTAMQPDDIVLIKASNGMKLEQIVNNLLG